MSRTRALLLQMLLLVGVLALSGVSLSAETYPSRPIRWLVGYPAGGGSDILTRIVAEAMSQQLGQSIVVENRAGASGNLAAAALSQADPDGYTLLMADRSTIVLNPVLFKNPGFNPVKDFSPVGLIASFPLILAVGPAVKAFSLAEFIALARAEPGHLSYASPGPGTQQELAFEIFKMKAGGLDINQVRYKGGSQPLIDIVQNRISATIGSYPNLLPFLGDGSLRALAVAQKQRLSSLPDVPTFVEAGIDGLDNPVWNALFTRSGTPSEVVERLTGVLSRSLQSELVAKRIAATGWGPEYATPDQMNALIRNDLKIWPPVAKQLGINFN
jgi:tripartite-type tricarboxylate transporter receptor subunit TctC